MRLHKQLHDGLRQITDDNNIDNIVLAPDSLGDLTRKKLGSIWENSVVDQFISMVDHGTKYVTPLSSLSINTFPDGLKEKILYDNTTQMLRFNGPMTDEEKTILQGLPGADIEYQKAIDDVYQQPRDFLKNTKAAFLDLENDALKKLLDIPLSSSEERFDYILTLLLPYIRNILNRSLVKQTLSDALKIDPGMAELLLEILLTSTTKTDQLVIEDFLALLQGGLYAEYFSGGAFDSPLTRRIDTAIAFDGKQANRVNDYSAGNDECQVDRIVVCAQER